MPTTDLHVGSKVWVLNGRKGRLPNGKVDYDRLFIEREIIGETSRSWIVLNWCNDEVKIAKSDLRGIYTDDQRADYIWLQKNKWEIVRKIEHSNDVGLFRKIEALIGEANKSNGNL